MFGNWSTYGNTIVKNIPAVEIFATLIVIVVTIITKRIVIAYGERISTPPISILSAIQIHDYSFANVRHTVSFRRRRTSCFQHRLKTRIRSIIIAVLLERTRFETLIYTRHGSIFIAWNEFVRRVIGAQGFLVNIAKVEAIDRGSVDGS